MQHTSTHIHILHTHKHTPQGCSGITQPTQHTAYKAIWSQQINQITTIFIPYVHAVHSKDDEIGDTCILKGILNTTIEVDQYNYIGTTTIRGTSYTR